MFAAEIASDGRYGKGGRTGDEMEERFFLDRVDVQRNNLAVNEAVKGAVVVFAHGAYAPLPVMYKAVVGAETAPDVIVPQLFIQHRFLHDFNYSRSMTVVNGLSL